ncbi:MAG: T9SS type A sorting domain-containing protein [Bacteroidia bacterium]|nr:T9SS type A sorting domain-containing protein [Bacteroidia bacterium]
MASTSGGTSFLYDVALKNNGTDSVFTTDTLLFRLIIAEGNQGILGYPNFSQFIIRTITRNLGPGDTMHLSGSLSTTFTLPFSKNVSCIAQSLILNNSAKGVFNETSTTNNSLTTNLVWTNQYGWGVSLDMVFVNNLSIYPNPAREEVTINTGLIDASAGSELTITDMTGRIVYTETVNMAAGVVVNISNFDAGIYNVNIKNGKLSTNGKLIVR